MSRSSTSRRVCVLDIETRPRTSPPARADGQVPRGGDRTYEHEIGHATVLTFVEDEQGAPGSLDLRSFSAAPGEDGELVDKVERAIPEPGEGALVTFNGIGHDLPSLRYRAMADWSFECRRIEGWSAGRGDHFDLMELLSSSGAGRWPSLASACAGLSIPAKSLPARSRRGADAELLMNQCDVMSTFLLYLHWRSLEVGTCVPIATGWSQAADLIIRLGEPRHLEPFASHPLVRLARRLQR